MQERPVRVYGGHNPKETTFDNTRDAAQFLSNRLSSVWNIGTIAASGLSGEQIKLFDATRMHVAHVEPYQHNPVMDRGLVWADRNGENVLTQFGLSAEHGLTDEDLEARIDSILTRGDEYVVGVLEGHEGPPYSQNYPV